MQYYLEMIKKTQKEIERLTKLKDGDRKITFKEKNIVNENIAKLKEQICLYKKIIEPFFNCLYKDQQDFIENYYFNNDDYDNGTLRQSIRRASKKWDKEIW